METGYEYQFHYVETQRTWIKIQNEQSMELQCHQVDYQKVEGWLHRAFSFK